ncbi:hypothetical protein [Georgenia muralis]
MSVHMRTGRGTTSLVTAIALVVVGGSAALAAPPEEEEEEGTKNLSVPVILADDGEKAGLFNAVTVPGLPTGDADYTNAVPGDEVPDGDYYTGVGSDTYPSTVDPEFDADMWGADRTVVTDVPVVTDVKWGDNLLSHTFPGTGTQPIRVEVNLFAHDPTAFEPMLGYDAISLEGEMRDELFGTDGLAAELAPMVFAPGATLTILKAEEETGTYSEVAVSERLMPSEVNASGRLIYGFNWGSPSGVANPGVGWYRLIFTVPDDSVVQLQDALLGDDEEGEEGPTNVPYIRDCKTATIDVALGAPGFPEPVQQTGFFLADDFGSSATTLFEYGVPEDEVFMGDWDGDGTATPGYRRGTTFSLRNSNTTGVPEIVFGYGRSTDEIVVGDWDGDGTDTIGLRRVSTWYLKNTLTGGAADVTLTYGRSTDTVLAGDWDGDGDDTPGVRRLSTFYLSNTLTGGSASVVFTYGRATDEPFAADGDGDGDTTVGVRRANVWYLRDSLAGGAADLTVAYGRSTDTGLVGDWDGDGIETLGIHRAL